jgi:hypothetical protein
MRNLPTYEKAFEPKICAQTRKSPKRYERKLKVG